MVGDETFPQTGESADSDPLHHAIDLVSAALVKVQLLERKMGEVDGLPAELDQIAVILEHVGELLHQAQDSFNQARH